MYNGNSNLRSAGETVEYTEEMINEIIKCSEDIIYFAENYFKIVTSDEGKKLIELYDYQKKILKAYIDTPEYTNMKTKQKEKKKFLIIKIPRQMGKCHHTFNIIKEQMEMILLN